MNLQDCWRGNGKLRSPGSVENSLGTLFILLALLFAADAVCAALQTRLSEKYVASIGTSTWLNYGYHQLFVNVSAYAVVFGVAGALVARRASSAIGAFVLALVLGLAHPLLRLIVVDHSALPFTYITHAPWWIEALFWANWYIPPMAAVVGGRISRTYC